MDHKLSKEIKQYRKSTFPIEPFLLNRWSPRAMTGEALTDEELMPLFEAARWAPSSYNAQPWRFLFARRDTPEFAKFLDLLIDFNKQWCQNAAVLVCIISHNTFEHNGKPAATHSFDTGSAWMSLALQASAQGLVTHGMQGFDYEKAKKSLHIPDGYTVEAMAAIGKKAPKESLPKEMQEREAPSDRKPLKEIIMEGKFRT